jgi:hypothetical protein
MPVLFLVLALLIGVGFVWVLFASARHGTPSTDPNSGAVMFRHSAALRWFAVFALFGAQLLFGVWIIVYPPQTTQSAIPVAAGALTLGLAGVLLCWEAYRYALIVTEQELDCRSPWRGRQVVPWNLVSRVEFSAANAWFVLRFVGGGSFRVPAVVPGVGSFLAHCERHLKPEQLRSAKAGYPLIGRKWPFQE